MMIDILNAFLAPGAAAQSMVGGAGTAIQIGNVIDLLGEGVGQAPVNTIGNAALFGEDPGIGRYKMEIQLNVGTAFATGNAATATFSLQEAADTGSPNFQPDAWTVAGETGAIAAANLTADAVIKLAMPPAPPAVPRPRFLRLVMTPPAATNFNAGTVTFAGLVVGRDDQTNKQAASNYTVR